MTIESAGPSVSRRVGRRLLTTLMMSTALCFGALPMVLPVEQVAAQGARTHRFNIPSQPLSRALRVLSGQSGVQIAYQTSIASGVTAPAVSGTMTTEQALAQLLSGSSLSYSFTNANTVTVVGGMAAAGGDGGVATDGSLVLAPIVVEGQGNPNSTIGNLSEPYAGGQIATGAQVGMLGNRTTMNTPFQPDRLHAQEDREPTGGDGPGRALQ
jgi:hypothetical protein